MSGLVRAFPALGEVFELGMVPFTSREMIEALGFLGEIGFYGDEIAEPQVRRFKLVQAACSDDSCNIGHIRKLVECRGNIPAGQWIVPFNEAFPPDGSQHKIGILDRSWRHIDIGEVVPCITKDGQLGFHKTSFAMFPRGWLWIVEAKA